MCKSPMICVDELKGSTAYAPLVALGNYVRMTDLLSPLESRVCFPAGMHTEHPTEALIDLWISMLAGCQSVFQINSKLRPDHTLAKSWGRSVSFAEQSTVARILDHCQTEQVAQFSEGIQAINRWICQSYQHPWPHMLTVDIDLTELPASARAQGSTKGYFQEKGGADANCDEWV